MPTHRKITTPRLTPCCVWQLAKLTQLHACSPLPRVEMFQRLRGSLNFVTSPLGEEKYSPFPFAVYTVVKRKFDFWREGEGRKETASDLPSLIFIGNERISFAFFLSVHDFARIITRWIISRTRQTRERRDKINSRQIANDPSLKRDKNLYRKFSGFDDGDIYLDCIYLLPLGPLDILSHVLPVFSFLLIESIPLTTTFNPSLDELSRKR